jgi:hypothetical protein
MNTQPTPISDRIVSQFRKGQATSDGLILTMVELELKLAAICRERDEARETIAATLRAWQTAQEKIIAVTAQRDENETWKQIASGRLSKIAEVTAQRDRLAEVMSQILNTTMNHTRRELLLEQALQSLTPNSQDR